MNDAYDDIQNTRSMNHIYDKKPAGQNSSRIIFLSGNNWDAFLCITVENYSEP